MNKLRVTVACVSLLASATVLFTLVPAVQASIGSCTYNTGYCAGDCYINTGNCYADGTCYINTSECDSACYVNLGTCDIFP